MVFSTSCNNHRQSDSYVRVAYETLMKYLAKDHAEIRLSSFQAMNEIFRRSHLFRELLTSDFQRFVLLSCGSHDDQLPPPSTAASRLKEESVLAIRQWVEKFGEGYPKLKIGYNFLKHTKKVWCACACSCLHMHLWSVTLTHHFEVSSVNSLSHINVSG